MAALKIAENAYGENGVQYGFLLFHLGQMYSLISDYSAAETMFRRAVVMEGKITGSDPLDHALLVSSLANVYLKQRKLEEAKPLVLESREAATSNCSASPMACALIHSNLGDYYLAKGQWALAETEFEAALKLRENTLGEHPLVADSLLSLSHALRKAKRKVDAKTYEAQAARILSSQKSPLYGSGNTIDVRAFQAANR
jgi:tetratricopeptide (TPR) repeat protein